MRALKRGIYRETKQQFKIAVDRMHDALACEKAWSEHVRRLPAEISNLRFIRYSPEFARDLPSLDDVGQLDRLQEAVGKDLERKSALFQKVAMQLVATSFYFEYESIQQRGTAAATITGQSCNSNPLYVTDHPAFRSYLLSICRRLL